MNTVSDFIQSLRDVSSETTWFLYNGSIRSSEMSVGGFPSDTITFLANKHAKDIFWSSSMVFDAAEYLKLPFDLMLDIVAANDSNGHFELRSQILSAVGLN